MGLVRMALKNFYGMLVVAALISVLGLVALLNIPVDILPSFRAPAVQVMTFFQGMPARSTERVITDRIERWVNQSPGVSSVESRSLSGISVVRLLFRDDTDPTAALTMTNSLALAALPNLPPNTLPPVVIPYDPTGTLPLGILTVSNPSLDEAGIKDLARVNVRNSLGRIRGSVAPVVVGGKDRRVMVYLDPRKLEARNLSPLDIVRSLDEGNFNASPGTAYFGTDSVALDMNSLINNVEDFNLLPIRIGPDQQVLLGDIGRAEDSSVIQTSRVRVNGQKQVFVPIYRQAGASSLAVTQQLRDELPNIEKELPEGSKLEFLIDQTESVKHAIDSLIHEGLIGAVLVSVMILLFLGDFRLTVIALLMMPLAILCGIVGLWTTTNTINVMTLAGLFLAIGPLVDNAIVVLENTHRHLGLGRTRLQAAYLGAAELILPVLVATLATIIVLAPIAMMPGLGSFLFKPLALGVAFCMIASFGLACTFIPAMCANLLKVHKHTEEHHAPHGAWAKFQARFQGMLDGFTARYAAILALALRNRGPVLMLIAATFASSLLLFRGIGQEFFPQVDAGQITMLVRTPSKLRLDSSEERIIQIEEFLNQQIPPEDRQMIVSEIGLNPDWSSAYTQNAGQMDAVIRIQLTPEREFKSQEYAIRLRKALKADPRFADLDVAFDTGGIVSAALNFGASSPIDLQLTGGKPDQRLQAAKAIRDRVADIRGSADVRIMQRNDAPNLIIRIDRQQAAKVGLSARDVGMQVVTAMNSSIALSRNFWIDPKSGNQYFVAVQYPEDPNFKLENLQNVFATGTRQSTPVRLSSLVEIQQGRDPVELTHVGLKRVTNILVNTENRDIGGVAGDIEVILKQMRQEGAIPPEVNVELKGEYARMQESFASLGSGLILASILVYLLMVPLFRSFLGPLIILFTIPLGLIGVLVTLYVTGTTLNVQSEMGIIFLVGIVVSNGVLLIDYANKLRKQGMTVREAVVTSATTRFKPIMMTFLATFLDLLPLALGLGKGNESITPLARAVVGGLLSSTFLTLIVVPVLYTILIRESKTPEADVDAELASVS